ncbi:twin-arginine translocase subunit TatC [Novosphingobium sp. KCTC 2891]|uniref:twin-arginine translocase subunit TatC n=1 Tax=Novosphingobium sp. KCTC 2891 TaxID=2989730 RepID=UPI0022215C5C|nr:twin-arginine translocase subunit TatC [Novosphingobium sp. KCTC 2891]MCW1381239.1 twin-arginine translocase subunit TatC [Novosphingobium sp. KCTC 2891]
MIAPVIKDLDETQAPLLDHLLELRTRLLRCVYALAIASAASYYFVDQILAILVHPLSAAFPDGHGKLIYTKLYSAFFVNLKVALFSGFLFSFPVVANQLWAFVAPGLYAREKKAFLPFLVATPVLFAMGASLAYFIVMPTAFKWFIGFQGDKGGLQLEALPGIEEYLSLVMQFILAFGVSFLLPVLLMLLNRAGIVTRAQLVGARRYVVVGITAVAAVITPPDVVSQLMLAIPLLVLFEGTLVVMRFVERADAKAKAEEEAAAASAAAEGPTSLVP